MVASSRIFPVVAGHRFDLVHDCLFIGSFPPRTHARVVERTGGKGEKGRKHLRVDAHAGHVSGAIHISQCSMYQPERSIFGAGSSLLIIFLY
jgi:hypothetical protein